MCIVFNERFFHHQNLQTMSCSPKIQKQTIGVDGSFFNQLMANNSTLPEVGKGATQLHYTDRTCFEVVEVSGNGETAKLEYLKAKADPTKENGMGHQNWIFENTGNFLTVTWRKSHWAIEGTQIIFAKKFVKECEAKGIPSITKWLNENHPEIAQQIWDGNAWPINVVEGYTVEKKVYSKINILFGVKKYFYDWSF